VQIHITQGEWHTVQQQQPQQQQQPTAGPPSIAHTALHLPSPDYVLQAAAAQRQQQLQVVLPLARHPCRVARFRYLNVALAGSCPGTCRRGALQQLHELLLLLLLLLCCSEMAACAPPGVPAQGCTLLL
jgi:hypothetical protein